MNFPGMISTQKKNYWITKRNKMKKLLLLISLVMIFAGCAKKKELSQEDRERSEPLLSNQLIENEHGGIRFFISNGQAQLQSTIPVFTTTAFANYFIEADKLPRNSSIELTFAGTGTFDLDIEGFTAPPTGMGKRIKMPGLPGGVKFRLDKGIVKYTFTKL
jgi:hypothetical protein